MPRVANQFYGGYPVDPGFAIAADNLGTALFGNPALALEQARGQAQIGAWESQAEQNRAQAGYYGAQTEGERQRNAVTAGLPELMARFAGSFQQPPAAPMQGAPAAVPGMDATSLGGILAAAAMMQEGKGIDEILGVLPAYLGTDEQARRALVGRGVTPGKEFALTPERADAVAQQGYDAERAKATGVANIQAGASMYGADQDYKAKVYDTNVDSATDIKTTGIKEAGADRRDAGKPLSVAGQIYDPKTGKWIAPPPQWKPPMLTTTEESTDAAGNVIKRTRTAQVTPKPGAVPVNKIVTPPGKRRKYNPATGQIE
jgi:hypothetical protein